MLCFAMSRARYDWSQTDLTPEDLIGNLGGIGFLAWDELLEQNGHRFNLSVHKGASLTHGES